MTLGELRARMGEEEMMGWHAYFTHRAEVEEKAYEDAKRRVR